MEKNEVLRVENVIKKYGKQTVLNNINFSLREREIIGLVGPNGAGKSTLMSILVGLINNYQGNVYIDNVNIRKKNKTLFKQIGCMIETPGFYPNLTGHQNLNFFGEIAGGVPRCEIDEIGEMLGIKDSFNKKVRKYSLGMKQRLGIAQAVLRYPKILILDEPTNGLDPSIIPEIRKFIKYISDKKNISILVSSHILSEIEMICEKVILMQDGMIIKELTIQEFNNDTNANIFIFESSDVEKLLLYLESENIWAEKKADKSVTVKINSKLIDNLISNIVKADITIRSVYEYKNTLEEKFLETMGESSNE